MRVIARGWRRLRTWMHPHRFEREMNEELSFHLEMQTRWHQSRGLHRDAAAALAAREFGGETRFREAIRDARGMAWTHDLVRDARIAVRSYARSVGFTTVALATLALGIGITTAAFSIIHAVLVRPLPYPESERIVTLTGRDSVGNDIQSVFLTGGSTAIAEVRRQVLKLVPQARPVTGDLFGSVGLGLAIDAERRFGAGRA